MPFDVSQAIYPKGRLREEWFGEASADDGFTQTVKTWAAYAEALSEGPITDEAALAYVYWRGFQTYADKLNAEAADVDVRDQVSRKYLKEQMFYWQREAREARQRYEALAGEDAQPNASAQGASFGVMRSRR